WSKVTCRNDKTHQLARWHGIRSGDKRFDYQVCRWRGSRSWSRRRCGRRRWCWFGAGSPVQGYVSKLTVPTVDDDAINLPARYVELYPTRFVDSRYDVII